MKIDICYIISHGFAARMLLQTNLIGRLTDLNLNVAIVTPDIKDENLAIFFDNPKVELIQWESKTSIWDDDYLHKRMYFLEDINKNVALKEKFWNSLFFSTSKHPWKRIRPLYYYCIFLLIKKIGSIRTNFLINENKHLNAEEADAIIERLKPKLVVSTYPVSIIEAKILHASKKKNVPTLLHLLSWDNISCKGKFPVLPERFIVWGDEMREELKEYYPIEDNKISICGVAHFDEHIKIRKENSFKKVIKAIGLDAESPYLFFAMSSPRFAPREIDIVEWLSDKIENNIFGKDMQLVIRPHPQNVQTYLAKESWLVRLERLKSARVAIDYPSLSKSKLNWSMKKEDMRHLSSLIAGCAINLNSGSTVSIDSLMHNKPVILTSFDGNSKLPYWNSARRLVDYSHLKKFVSKKGAVSVNSFEELKSIILKYLDDPEFDLETRRNVLIRYCFKDDGQSTERVIKSLQSTLSQIA